MCWPTEGLMLLWYQVLSSPIKYNAVQKTQPEYIINLSGADLDFSAV